MLETVLETASALSCENLSQNFVASLLVHPIIQIVDDGVHANHCGRVEQQPKARVSDSSRQACSATCGLAARPMRCTSACCIRSLRQVLCTPCRIADPTCTL